MFPLFIDLRMKKCIVVGGGRVAKRKIGTLLEFGAEIIVVSPEITDEIRQLEEEGRLAVREKKYAGADIRDAFLVIAAAGDGAVNEQVWEDAVACNVFVNVADNPEKCTFVFPSVVRRGDVVVGITTSAGFPALSKHLREQIDGLLPEELGKAADLLKEARNRLLQPIRDGLPRETVGSPPAQSWPEPVEEAVNIEIGSGSGYKDVAEQLLQEVLECCRSNKMDEAKARIEKILKGTGRSV